MRTATIIKGKQYEINKTLSVLSRLLFRRSSSKIKRRPETIYPENTKSYKKKRNTSKICKRISELCYWKDNFIKINFFSNYWRCFIKYALCSRIKEGFPYKINSFVFNFPKRIILKFNDQCCTIRHSSYEVTLWREIPLYNSVKEAFSYKINYFYCSRQDKLKN